MRRAMMVVAIGGIALITAACTPEVTVENTDADATGAPASGISVTGIGKVTGTPDTLTISFGVSVRRDTVAEAVAVAAERADAIIGVLIDDGISEDDIQTANYSIRPVYDYSTDTEVLVGYQVNNSVTVKVRDIDSAGPLIDDIATAGGDEVTVSGVSFSIEDNEELIEAARASAWAEAETKAVQLAELAGVTLGSPTFIDETFSTPPPPIALSDASFAAASEISTPIVPGTQQVAVTLNVRFSITN
jgi:hypothetical protein